MGNHLKEIKLNLTVDFNKIIQGQKTIKKDYPWFKQRNFLKKKIFTDNYIINSRYSDIRLSFLTFLNR